MMNCVHYGHTYSNISMPYPAHSDVPHFPAKKKSIPTGGDPSAKQLIFNPIPPNNRTRNAWTTIAWPTNIQSKTPDGKFGPAKLIKDLGDCWFLAPLAAVANDPDGQKILAESIKKMNYGYAVTFKGSPHKTIYIADAGLQKFLEDHGGDADTRLMELAAYKFFTESGSYRSLYLATLMRRGINQARADRCFQDLCQRYNIQDPMTYNPMINGAQPIVAFFMFTNIYPDSVKAPSSRTIQRSDVIRFLNQYTTNDRDGTSVVINGIENPLGESVDCLDLVIDWDVIRTEITSNGTVDEQERAFLNALDKWLETRMSYALEALGSAAGNLHLEHIDPVEFVDRLARNLFNMDRDHFSLLQSGVREVLAGGPGYIGFPGSHSGTIEGINEATNTFTYSEHNFPSLVHTGALSDLIQAVRFRKSRLHAFKPTTGQDEAESSHAGEKRGRHLRETHDQVAGDGKIDPAESGPLANLMEMDDSAFWQVYDSDKNGVIEGGELEAVQLRVDRWVEHFRLTPIW